MRFRRNVKYNGQTYIISVNCKGKSKEVKVNDIQCQYVIKQFRNLKNCFITRAQLNNEDVIVIIYGRNAYIESCPIGDFKAYFKQRFAPAIGNDFLYKLSLGLGLVPFGSFGFYITKYIGGIRSVVFLLFLVLYLFSSTYLLNHPGFSKGKRLIFWVISTVAINAIAIVYSFVLIQS